MSCGVGVDPVAVAAPASTPLPAISHSLAAHWHDRRCDRPLIRNLYFRAMQSINVMFGC